jgi:uncharacterized protein
VSLNVDVVVARIKEFRRGAKRVYLIGGDFPGLSRDYFYEADAALDGNEVVIGPAYDGGYGRGSVGVQRCRIERSRAFG